MASVRSKWIRRGSWPALAAAVVGFWWWKLPEADVETVWSRDDCDGVVSSPDGDVLVVRSDKQLIRLDPQSGSALWAVASDGLPRGLVQARNLVIAAAPGEVHAYQLSDGRPSWKTAVSTRPSRIWTADDSVVAVTDEEIIVLSDADGTPRWKRPAEKVTRILSWDRSIGVHTEPNTFVAFDLNSGNEQWRISDACLVSNVHAGLLQVTPSTGKSRLVNAKTGQEQGGLLPREEAYLIGGSRDRLYFTAVSDGSIICIVREEGRELWRTRPPLFRGQGAFRPLPPVSPERVEERGRQILCQGMVQVHVSAMREPAYRLDAYSDTGKLLWVVSLPAGLRWIRPPYVLCMSNSQRHVELIRIPELAER